MSTTRQLSEPHCRSFLQLLRATDKIWSASRAFLSQWSLSPGQFVVLALLHGKPSGCTQVELSEELSVSRSRISGVVGRLVNRRLVHREIDPEHRRIRHITLTGEGAKLLDTLLPHCQDFAEQSWAGLAQERFDPLLIESSRPLVPTQPVKLSKMAS